MAALPRPEVTVTHASDRDPSAPTGSMDVVITDGSRAKSYRVGGDDGPAIVKDAVEQIIGDRHTAEWLP